MGIYAYCASLEELKELERKAGTSFVTIKEFCDKNNFSAETRNSNKLVMIDMSVEREFLNTISEHISCAFYADLTLYSNNVLPYVYTREDHYFREKDLQDCLNLKFPALERWLNDHKDGRKFARSRLFKALKIPYKFEENSYLEDSIVLHNYISDIDVKLPLSTTMSINEYADTFIPMWKKRFYDIRKNFSSQLRPLIKKSDISPTSFGSPMLYTLKDLTDLYEMFVKEQGCKRDLIYKEDFSLANDCVDRTKNSVFLNLEDFKTRDGWFIGSNNFRNLVCREKPEVLVKFPVDQDFDSEYTSTIDFGTRTVNLGIPLDWIVVQYDCDDCNIIWDTKGYVPLDNSFVKLSSVHESFNKLLRIYSTEKKLNEKTDSIYDTSDWDEIDLAAELLWKAIASLIHEEVLRNEDIFYYLSDFDTFELLIKKSHISVVQEALIQEIRKGLNHYNYGPHSIMHFLNEHKDSKYSLTELEKETKYTRETARAYALKLLKDNLIKVVDTIKSGTSTFEFVYQSIDGPDSSIPIIKEDSSEFKELGLISIPKYAKENNIPRTEVEEHINNSNIPYYIGIRKSGGCDRTYKLDDLKRLLKNELKSKKDTIISLHCRKELQEPIKEQNVELDIIKEDDVNNKESTINLFSWVKNFNFFGFQVSISKKRKKTIANSGQDIIEF